MLLEEQCRGDVNRRRHHIVAGYDRQSTALFATARLWDDGLIDPRDSRATLAFCLETCAEAEARVLRPNTFGVARF